MHIKNVLQGLNPYEQKKVGKSEKAEAQAKSRAAREGDTVSLSESARLTREADAAAREDDGVRAERVAELKARIQNGTYTIDNHKVAENLLRDEMDLFM